MYKNLESSEIGRDMFDNDVRIGQKVLYMRADPGGVGIGEVIDIRISNKSTKDKPLKEYIGYRYGYSSKKSVNEIFYYKLKTLSGAGFATDIPAQGDPRVLDITYNISVLLEIQKILSSIYFTKHK